MKTIVRFAALAQMVHFLFLPSSLYIGHNIYGLRITAFVISRSVCSKLRLWYLLFVDKSQVTCHTVSVRNNMALDTS